MLNQPNPPETDSPMYPTGSPTYVNVRDPRGRKACEEALDVDDYSVVGSADEWVPGIAAADFHVDPPPAYVFHGGFDLERAAGADLCQVLQIDMDADA